MSHSSGFHLFSANAGITAFDISFEAALRLGERAFDWEAGRTYCHTLENGVTTWLFQISHLQGAPSPSFRDGDGKPKCGTQGNVIAGCVPLDFLSSADTITPEMLSYISLTAHDQFEYGSLDPAYKIPGRF